MKKNTGFWTNTSKVFSQSSLDICPKTITFQMSTDNYMQSATATTNNEGSGSFLIGDIGGGLIVNRAWIKPDFSGLGAGHTFESTILNVTPIEQSYAAARTLYAYRCLRATVSTQQTWNIWKTSNNWGTGGASNSSTDYDGATLLGSVAISSALPLNVPLSMTLNAAELQKLYDGTYTNNGIILFVSTQTNDIVTFASLEHGTTSYRPSIVVEYL